MANRPLNRRNDALRYISQIIPNYPKPGRLKMRDFDNLTLGDKFKLYAKRGIYTVTSADYDLRGRTYSIEASQHDRTGQPIKGTFIYIKSDDTISRDVIRV